MSTALAIATVVLLTVGSGPVAAESPDPVRVTRQVATTTADGSSVSAAATAVQAATTDTFVATSRAGRPLAPALVRHMRAEICGVYSAAQDSIWPCAPR